MISLIFADKLWQLGRTNQSSGALIDVYHIIDILLYVHCTFGKIIFHHSNCIIPIAYSYYSSTLRKKGRSITTFKFVFTMEHGTDFFIILESIDRLPRQIEMKTGFWYDHNLNILSFFTIIKLKQYFKFVFDFFTQITLDSSA